ncbi:MAG: hypothetical protein AB8B55_13320 [Mariniblastus sp.]
MSALLVFSLPHVQSQETDDNFFDPAVREAVVVDDFGLELDSIETTFSSLPAIGSVVQTGGFANDVVAGSKKLETQFGGTSFAAPQASGQTQAVAPPQPINSNVNDNSYYSPSGSSLTRLRTQPEPFSSNTNDGGYNPLTGSKLARPESPGEPKAATKLPVTLIAPTSVASVASESPQAFPSQKNQTETPEYFVQDPVVMDSTVVAPVVCYQCESASCVGCNQSSCDCGETGCRRCSRNRGRTRLGRFFQGVHAGICNDDPCYQPQWTMLANASLFTDSARPQSRQRFRWDYNDTYLFPDRAEYLWARSGVLGPAPERSINFHELSMYVETGSDKFSFFVETPYRSIYLDSGGHFAGFADITTGTKTLLHDTSLVQVALQFETHVLTSSPTKGLSNGHITLEPSLLFGIQASPRSFLQGQIGQWIPIAGDPTFAGGVLKYSASYNRTLIQSASNTSLTGTIEYSGLSFQDGAYTDPATFLPVSASNESIGMLGTGLRLNICDKFNIGFGVQYGVTDISPQTAFRTEFQFRH